ncbi:MAG: serine/threonine protein kinase [Gemmatimonadales bacterium]|nr:serine/threonine protein kinase [Gemmatimonadales bacterium]
MRRAVAERYTVDREIARGGAARVFLAYDRDGKAVALKVLHPQLAVSVTADRFLREIKFLSSFDHPNIGRLIDCGESEWLIYYVMVFVEGPNLREHLARVRRASVADTVRIAADLLGALEYAHAKGIVHRDVKPENIVVSGDRAVLVDFGIARAIAQAGTERLTRSGFAVGTSAYMSPEQIQGVIDIDERTDVYSLGCVLFECLTGRPPFTAERDDLVLRMHLDHAAPEVRSLREDVPESLALVIDRSLKGPREARWQSATEMRRALDVLVGQPGDA